MYLIFVFKNIIEHFYIKYNNTPVIFKRDFNNLSFFEKTFLSFFHRKNIFSSSIANIYQNYDLLNYRKNNHPLIFFFHLYFDKVSYSFISLKFFYKQFNFFYKSKFFIKTLNSLKNTFFKKINIHFFLMFLIIQKILYKRYYNLCSSVYFKTLNINNLVKLNWLFYLFLNNSKNQLNIYDLSKYSDWYEFNFRKNSKFQMDSKNQRKKKFKNFRKFNITNKIDYKSVYYKYNSFFKKLYLSLNQNYKNIISVNYNFFKKTKINLNQNWFNNLKNYYPIRFSETSISKNIKLSNLNNYVFFYIRKNRIFNKGRYSRNRQLYRTGVYWCLWLNIMLVYGLYFMFYRFTFNFGYFWWGLLILAYSSIFSRVLKYNFFNIFYIKNEFFNFLKWLGIILLNIRDLLLLLFKKNIIYILSFFTNIFKKNSLFNEINSFLLSVYLYLFNFLKFKNTGKFIYFWESMSQKDDSFLRYKSVIHWFVQFYKLLTY